MGDLGESIEAADMERLNVNDDEDDESLVDSDEEESADVKEKKAEPKRPAKIGYGRVEDMPAQHIRLLSPWIFDPSVSFFELYKDVLSESNVDLLQHALEEEDEYDRSRSYYYAVNNILSNDVRAHKIMNKFLQASPRALDIQHKIYFTHPDCLPESFFTYWEKLIYNFQNHPTCQYVVDRICFCMKIGPILGYLRTSPEAAYRNVYEKLKMYAEADTFEGLSDFQRFMLEWKARSLILIELITAKPKKHKPHHWYFEFLKACNTAPETRGIALYLERNFRDVLNEYEIEVSKLTKPTHKSTADFVDPSEAPVSARPQDAFGKRPSDITGEYTCNYELRKYQQELTIKAKEGLNTIICAPTGSGKTHVAADIISHHLRRFRNTDKVGRVAMFVPTIPLVNQQSLHLSTNLRPEFYVEKLSGAEKSEKGDIRKVENILRADVVVLTPQIFINMLLSPLRSQKIYVTDFSMFVFDECHHCNELHPYNVLMNIVRESNFKPQIVGLTASVGDGGDAKSRMDPESAMQHMVSLCARLNADTVTSIRNPENILEMHYHISKPLDEIIACRPPPADDFAHEIALISDYVQEKIQDVLHTAVEDILDFGEDLIKLPLEGPNGKNGKMITSYRYNGKLGILKHNIDKRDLNRDRRHFLLKSLELLEICHFTLRNNELMPAKYAFQYFTERITEVGKFGANEVAESEADTQLGMYLQRLREMINYIQGRYEYLAGVVPTSNRKPIYNELLKRIAEQYTSDPTSRIIIFVESRKGCVKMAESLKEEVDAFGFKKQAIGHIVSVNQSMAKHGQSVVTQNQILKAFRQGSINILVATSVAEEGLDVAQCNLIIKYNSVGSEKSYIQRRGRARAKNSRSVLLAISTSVEQQEYNNIMREHLMNVCLENLQNLSERELKNMIQAKKDEITEQMEQNRKKEEMRKSVNNLFRLICYTCGDFICISNEVACLMESQFVCCNPAAWVNTKIKRRFQKAFSQSVSSLCGEWICRCGQKRGEVIKYGEAYLPTISADGFRLQKQTSTAWINVEYKKATWKVVRDTQFAVGSITAEQIRLMINSLADNNLEAFDEAQTNEEIGILEAVKNLEYKKKEKHALKETC